MGKERVKVLHVLTGGKSFTGVSSYLYQYYKNMDRTKVLFDFLFCRENSLEIHLNDPVFKDSSFFALNATTKGNSTDYRKLIKGIKKVIKEGEYNIVIVNTSVVMVAMATLMALPRNNKIVFIAHAHNTDIVVKSTSFRGKAKSLFKSIDTICRHFIVKKADYLFACSKEAGRVTFGKRAIKLQKFRVINDAIDTNAFIFNQDIRDHVRANLGINDDNVVYGNVGKLSYRKNQIFLLKVFLQIYISNPKSRLWLIGEGPERTILESFIRENDLEEVVSLLGQRSDVNELMQGMDCFVFTTVSEGLGIVAIEAQAAGLTTVVSDGVPEDVLITDLISRLPLSEGYEKWAGYILNLTLNNRVDMREKIISCGFDIETEAKKFTDFLSSIYDK